METKKRKEEVKKKEEVKEQPPTQYLTPEPCIVKLSAMFGPEKEDKKNSNN